MSQLVDQLVNQEIIQETICKNLTFEEAFRFCLVFRIQNLTCPIYVIDYVTSKILTFPGINETTIRLYRQIKRFGFGRAFLVLAREGDIPAIQTLLNMGIDVNTKSGISSPLMIAMENEKYELVEFLLSVGADVNTCNIAGKTLLMAAVLQNNFRIVEIILNARGDINFQDNNGFTALHLAVCFGRYEIADLLLKKGADPNLVNNGGKSALTSAIRNKYQRLIELLREYGAV